MARHSNAKGVAWIALLIAVVALVLAWVAFNRGGQDVQPVVEQEVQEAIVDLRAEIEAANQADEPAATTSDAETEGTTTDQ